MRCDEAVRVLRWASGRAADGEPGADDVARAESLGLVARAHGSSTAETALAELKGQLANVRGMKAAMAELLRGGEAARAKQELAALTKEETDLRSRILAASEDLARHRPSAGGAARLTARGRELLEELEPRLGRVGARVVAAFEQELGAVRARFAELATAAAATVKELGTWGDKYNDADVRGALLGLAGVTDTPASLAARMKWAAGLLAGKVPDEVVPAACGVLLRHGADVARVQTWLADVAARQPRCVSQADAAWASLAGWGAGPDVIARGIWLSAAKGQTRPRSEGVLVAAAGSGAEERWDPLTERLTSLNLTDATLTAAILALHPAEPGWVLGRFEALHRPLARYARDVPGAPAALLSLLDGEPSELLDNLRIASAEVQKAGLAPGGLEGLALGLDLLLEVALGSSADDLVPDLTVATRGAGELALGAAVRNLPKAVAISVVSTTTAVGVRRSTYFRTTHIAHRPAMFSSG